MGMAVAKARKATAKAEGKFGYTTYKGTAPAGTPCASPCKTGDPPSQDPLRFLGTKSWCYTDKKKKFWGECGGCAAGRFKPTGKSECTGKCNRKGAGRCQTCFKTGPRFKEL